MKHEKTFETISKLKDIEIELHRLKNALEMANRALDAQRTWVGLTPTDMQKLSAEWWTPNENEVVLINWIEAKLKEKNSV